MKLEDIKRICEAATPGPWPRAFSRFDEGDGGAAAIGPIIRNDDEDEEDGQAQADQDFIAMARTVLPKLLKVAEAAKRFRDSGWDENGNCDRPDRHVAARALWEELAALESDDGRD